MKLNTFIFIAVLTCLAWAPSSAHAQEGKVYFTGYYGLNIQDGMEFAEKNTGNSGNLNYDKASSFGGALGIKYPSNLRLEAEFSYRVADSETVDFDNGLGVFPIAGEMETILTMINATYDFDMDIAISPFISGGIGMAWNSVDIDDSSGLAADAANDDIGLAWQVGTGLRYQMSPDLSLSGGYRFIDTVDLTVGPYEIDYNSHEFRMGLEYAFPPN